MSSLVATMADVAREAGVSVVTVDRVLNRRGVVRATTEQKVLDAAQRLNFALGKVQSLRSEQPAAPVAVANKRLGIFLLRQQASFYRALGQAIEAAAGAHPGVAGHQFFYFDSLGALECAALLLREGAAFDAIAVVCVDHPAINQAVAQLSEEGVAVYALVTDLTASQRAGYVGIDNRKAGRTAAWAIARLSQRPGKVGILLGDHRFLCQETCEISFRSWFREHGGQYEVIDPQLTLESADTARDVTAAMLREHPDLVGLYVSCGGREGVLDAVRASGRQGEIVVICHELLESTRRGLIEGVVDLVLSLPREAVAQALVSLMVNGNPASAAGVAASLMLPFDVIGMENI